MGIVDAATAMLRISRNRPSQRGGRPTVRGTRVTVDDILEMLAAGWRPEEIAEELEIPIETIYEALRFASNLGGLE